MGRKCQVCTNENRLAIDRMLVRGTPVGAVAKQFNVSPHSLFQHRRHHLSRQLLQSEAAKELLHSQKLLAEVNFMVEKCKDVLKRAEEKGSLNTSLGAIRELRSTLEFVTKLAVTLKEEKERDEHEEKRKQIEKLKRLSREELEQLESLLRRMERGEPEDAIDVTPSPSDPPN